MSTVNGRKSPQEVDTTQASISTQRLTSTEYKNVMIGAVAFFAIAAVITGIAAGGFFGNLNTVGKMSCTISSGVAGALALTAGTVYTLSPVLAKQREEKIEKDANKANEHTNDVEDQNIIANLNQQENAQMCSQEAKKRQALLKEQQIYEDDSDELDPDTAKMLDKVRTSVQAKAPSTTNAKEKVDQPLYLE